MKYLPGIALLAAFLGSGCTHPQSQTTVPVVSACELFTHPEQYAGQTVEVVGRINVQFESMHLVCLDEKPSDSGLGFGIWFTLNLDSIREESPAFYTMMSEGLNAAHRWKGGLIGDIRFRGRFILSEDWHRDVLDDGTQHAERFGFGHFGSYGAEIVADEILEYRSVIEREEETDSAR